MSQRLVSVSVRHDVRRAVVELQNLREDVADKATFRALNRALDKTATETGREIRKVYNVRQKAVTSALTKRRAHRASLTARLLVEGVKLGLIEFGARAVNPWNKKGRRNRRKGGGVSVKIKVNGGRELIPSAFIAVNPKTGRPGVWHRFNRPGGPPVKNLASVSVPQAFANEAVLRALQVVAKETFDKNFAQQIRFLTRQGGR